MSPAAIETHGVSKRYLLGARHRADTLRDLVTAVLRRGDSDRDDGGELWALRDVTMSVRDGEVVGVVGGNGAGKSTLLKVLARVTEPTEGVARMHGRVGALLEVGTGFHPELTGRENVFLNGAVLGMSRRDIRQQFDEIIAFAGVERFVDVPLKRYSSGMQLRLAFAVAATLEPDVVVVDEVLAVGDVEFQRRCLGRMSEFASEGRTVVFVSHDLGAVARLCERCVWLDRGQVRAIGPTATVLDQYLGTIQRGHVDTPLDDTHDDGPVRLERARVAARRDGTETEPRRSDPVHVTLRFRLIRPVPGLDVAFAIRTSHGVTVVDEAWSDAGHSARELSEPGSYEIGMTLPAILAGGSYVLHVWIGLVSPFEVLVDRDVVRFDLLPSVDDSAEATARPRLIRPDAAWTLARPEGQWPASVSLRRS